MRPSHPPSTGAVWLCLFVAMCCVLDAGPLRAQELPEPLPQGLLTASDPLDEQQVAAIESYVSQAAGVLCNSDSPQQVRQARERLMRPLLDRLTSPAVRQVIIRSAPDALRPCFNHNGAAAKMNALIIAAQLPGGGVADLAAVGLRDDNAGVRYWAAKVVVEVAGNGPADAPLFDNAQQQQLLTALRAAMGTETDHTALGQMFRALGALSIPAAGQAMLDILASRVDLHRDRITEALRADRQALEELQRRISVRRADGQNVDADLRRLALICGRYLQVIAHALHSQRVGDPFRDTTIQTVNTIEQVFGLALAHFAPNHAGGPPLLQPAQAEQWDNLLLNTYEWVGTRERPGILSTSRINIPLQDLLVPPPDGGAQPAPAQPQPQRAAET